MKKFIFYGLSLCLGLTLFIGVIWRVGFEKIWQVINDFSFGKWLLILILYSLALIITIYRWKLILTSQGYAIKMSKLIPAQIVGFTADYLTPSPNIGGEAIRAYVLKKDTGVGMTPGLASIVIDKIMDFSYALPFIIFGIYYIILHFPFSLKVFVGLVLVSLIFILLLGLFYYRILRERAFFGSILRFFHLNKISFVAKMMDGIGKFELEIIHFFHRDRKTFFNGLLLSFISGIATMTAFWLIITFLGLGAGVMDVLIISTMIVITFLLPIPGSFGGTETGQALIFSFLGYPAESGVVFTLIFRSMDLLKVGLGLLYLSHFGLKIGQTLLGKTNIIASSQETGKTLDGK